MEYSQSFPQISFAKQDRFRPLKLVTRPHFYILPSTRSERSASFGYGKKIYSVPKNSPSPNLYDIKSPIKEGISFKHSFKS